MLTREERTRGPGTLPVVKGLVWFTDGPRMKEGTEAAVYGQSLGWKLLISLGRYATVFRLRYMRSWPVLMKFKCMVDQRSTSVFALTVRRLWKHFRLPKQRLHQYNSAKRRWTTFPPGILWDCFGSLDILGYSTRRWNCQQARMRGYCSPVCWTWAVLGGL